MNVCADVCCFLAFFPQHSLSDFDKFFSYLLVMVWVQWTYDEMYK